MHETGKTTWKEITPVWFQKTTITKTGLVKFSYHYKEKTSNPCIAFELDTKISKQYSGYTLIEKDLRDAFSFLEEYQKIRDSENTIRKNLLLKALVRAIVITYGKCFTKASGRKVKLEEELISTDNLDAHLYIMKMRHEYVAHAGESEHETCKCVFLLPPEEKYRKGQSVYPVQCTELRQTITEEYFLERNMLLINEILEKVKDKLSDLIEMTGLKNIHPESFYAFSKNKGNRVILKENDITNLIRDSII